MKKIVFKCSSCGFDHQSEVKNLSGGMIRTLVSLCHRYQQQNTWIDAKQAGLSPGDLEKLLFWGFTQQQPPSGRKKKSGIWMPTQNGWNFAIGQITAASAVIVTNNTMSGYVEKQLAVQDVIKQEELQKLWNA